MKVKLNTSKDAKSLKATLFPDEQGLTAIKMMRKTLREEHHRWNMPLMSWKNGKIVKIKP